MAERTGIEIKNSHRQSFRYWKLSIECLKTYPQFLFTQFGLAKRIDSLQATLMQVRRETDDEISRLRDELLAKNRTLERLESQLREQTDYDDLKRQTE